MKKLLVIHGPNLNLLGLRETDQYGLKNIDEINEILHKKGERYNIKLEIFQSNSEGEIIDIIHSTFNKFNGIIINPGAYTHYSIAIRDAISAINIPTIEVHITNIHAREEFRQKSVIAPVTNGQISGFGYNSYIIALYAISNLI